ncbi:GTPase Era, mitochondrial-like isoform X3 [Macrobrachium nipponense]|uniref:GTPase Era, mitochondrial-like isoform X3 n=1 Tax=Macrobrachium nipponense TaxID=159736 RepID=UPI0030C83372
MVAQKKIEKTQDLDKEILIQKALNRKEKLLKKESENTPPQVNGKTDLTESADTLENCSHLTQHEVAEFTKDRKGWPYFQDVFMISALKESGVDDLRNYLLSKAYSAPWLFSSKVVTDQNPEEIALMTVREKFLETFKNEIPYTVKFDIERWDVSESGWCLPKPLTKRLLKKVKRYPQRYNSSTLLCQFIFIVSHRITQLISSSVINIHHQVDEH